MSSAKKRCLYLTAVAILAVFAPYIAQGRPSRSLHDAQMRKLFIRPVSVSPTQFAWQGHEVSVKEAWLEKTPEGEDLRFKLAFDGQLEFRDENPKVILEFRAADSGDQSFFSVGEFVCGRKWTPTALLKATVPGLSLKAAYICRDVQLKLPAPKTVRLRVGSFEAGSQTGNPVMSDVVLTFDLGSDSNNHK